MGRKKKEAAPAAVVETSETVGELTDAKIVETQFQVDSYIQIEPGKDFEEYCERLQERRAFVERSVLLWFWEIGRALSLMLSTPKVYGKSNYGENIASGLAEKLGYKMRHIYYCGQFYNKIKDEAKRDVLRNSGILWTPVRTMLLLEDKERDKMINQLGSGKMDPREVENEVRKILHSRVSEEPKKKAEKTKEKCRAAVFFKKALQELSDYVAKLEATNSEAKAVLESMVNSELCDEETFKAARAAMEDSLKKIRELNAQVERFEKFCQTDFDG